MIFAAKSGLEDKMLKRSILRAISLLLALVTALSVVILLPSCSGTPDSGSPNTDTQQSTVPSDNTPPAPQFEENPALKITELMVVNTVGAKDENGKTSPWIEFLNVSENEIELSEYSLQIDSGVRVTLPEKKLAPGEYALVFTNRETGANSVALTLSASRGALTVTHGDKISQNFVYNNKAANHSFIVANGSETPFPTPGYETVLEKDNLVISELIASNSLFPINGVDCDWIELYNASENAIDLSTYYASTDSVQPYRANLPHVTLGSGEYIVLACEKDLPFKLSKEGESVYITRNDGVLAASVTFGLMEKNTSWTFDNGISYIPSPGHPNTSEGYAASITDRRGLVITEVVSSNTKYSKFNKNYCDMVEIFNSSDEAVLLSDYYLSDKGSEPKMYRLPEITLEPGAYHVIYCDADVEGAAPIGISSDGENIWLTREDGYIADALKVPDIPLNRSWGRYENKLVYFSTPSMGSANPAGGHETITATPLASSPSGNYADALDITLSGEGNIYYTTDGTQPSNTSKKYSGETISVSANTSIRAIAYNGDKIPSYEVTYNYFIAQPDYTLPIIKISMSNDDLFGESGIYTNYNSKKEKTAHCAFYVDGNEEFSINCGIKVFGAYSRRFPKKSFQLEFRTSYGKGRLDYKIFENLSIDSFNNIVLRSGSQNCYATDAMIADEYASSLAAYSGNMPELLVQAYRPCHLYLNGEYWGIYFIREKVDDDFIADHCGVSKDSVTIIDWTNTLNTGSSKQGWNEIWNAVYGSKKRNFSKDENYKWLADQLDLESFADLIIMRMWAGDKDLPNIRAFKSPEYDDGKWHFILHDNDMSFRANWTRFNYFLNDSATKKTHALFRALMENTQFQEYFLGRMAYQLKTTLSVENAHARLDEMIAEIENDMPYQIARWKNDNNSYMTHLPSMNKWRDNVTYLYYCAGDLKIERFVQDAAKALKLDAEGVKKYLGEEFVEYVQ